MEHLLTQLRDLNELGEFYHKLRHKGMNLGDGLSVEDVAKKLRRKVPHLLEGCKISTPKVSDLKKFKKKLMVLSVKDKGKDPNVVERTKTWCALQCGEVPFAGFKCIMICVTCTTNWGGGCQITLYPPD